MQVQMIFFLNTAAEPNLLKSYVRICLVVEQHSIVY